MNNTHSITGILFGTPLWVWAVLIALIWAGWRQREDRVIAKNRAMLLSAILFFWSASSVAMASDNHLLTGIVWLCSVLVGYGLARRSATALPQATPQAGQVFLRGSDVPLVAFMVLFALHYLQGLSHAGVLDIHQTMWFVVVFAAASGVISGAFLARLVALVRIDAQPH
jgi:hypothetical protein